MTAAIRGQGSVAPWVWVQAVTLLVRRDLKLRYKNSALGFLWSFINPLMQIVVMTIVFKYIMGSTIKNFSVELLTCLLPWTFFLQSLGDGTVCLIKDAVLLKKYPFPRILLPAAALGSNFVHMSLSFIVLFVVFLAVPVTMHWCFLWVLPLLFIQACMTLGVLMILSAMQMYYEDVKFIITWVLQVVFFLSPILYPIEQVLNSTRLTPLMKELYIVGNPLAPLFIGYRTALLHGAQWPVPGYFGYLGISIAWAALLLVVGTLVWRRYEWQFPEMV